MSEVNVLFIICDTLRVDHVGCYGYFRETTPNIDRIAGEGVLFEDFYDAGCPTGLGFTCMYTGLHSVNHRFYAFTRPNTRMMDDTIFTMSEIMLTRGFTTAAVDNTICFPCHPKQFVRGWEYYLNPGYRHLRTRQVTAEEVNRKFIPWLRNHSRERFFLLVHYWDPHAPYVQPQEFRKLFHHEAGSLSDLEVREAPAGYRYVPGWGSEGEIHEGDENRSIDLYDGEIAYMDRAIGEGLSVLEGEGVLEETLVIVTSDHGEQLGQHGAWGHNALHDAVTHVPLIMRLPERLPRKARVKGFAQHIDLLPTVLELTESPVKLTEIDGQSLLPLLKGEPIRDWIFMEHTGFSRAVRTEEWKFIEYLSPEGGPPPSGRRSVYRRPPELYNVKEDPMETINLMEQEKERGLQLERTLHEWVMGNLKEGEEDPLLKHTYDSLYHRKREDFIQRAAKIREAFTS